MRPETIAHAVFQLQKTTRNKVYLWTVVAICLILWWYLLMALAIQRHHGFWEPFLPYHEVFSPPTNLFHYNVFFPLPLMWQVSNKSTFLTPLLKVTLTHLLGYLLGCLIELRGWSLHFSFKIWLPLRGVFPQNPAKSGLPVQFSWEHIQWRVWTAHLHAHPSFPGWAMPWFEWSVLEQR